MHERVRTGEWGEARHDGGDAMGETKAVGFARSGSKGCPGRANLHENKCQSLKFISINPDGI